jgi:hypothetical protein
MSVPEAIKGLPSWTSDEAKLVAILETWHDRDGARFRVASRKEADAVVDVRDAAMAKLQARNPTTKKPWTAAETNKLVGKLIALCDEHLD